MKPWYRSSGINGTLTYLVSTAGLLAAVGLPLPISDQALGALQMLTAAGVATGAGTALVGRAKATEPIATPWSKPPIGDVGDEISLALAAALKELMRSGELPNAGDALGYLHNRIQPGPVPAETAIAAAATPDVPPELLANLGIAPAELPVVAAGDRPAKYEFIAQQSTKVRAKLGDENGELIPDGDSIWAIAYRFATSKYLELELLSGQHVFLFSEHIKLRNQNGHYELVAMPDPVQPWFS